MSTLGDPVKHLLSNQETRQIHDQFTNGVAAKVWEQCIGDENLRAERYGKFLVSLLRQRGCRRILDAACGTGTDSIMLLEQGFNVVSVDLSDQMLKYALKKRWKRRKEPAFDNWVIEQANWLTLPQDIEEYLEDGFDAIICIGNSYSMLPDNYGDQREQKLAMENFNKCLKPGGILVIDHRNFEDILNTGEAPKHNIYYNGSYLTDMKPYVVLSNGKPINVIMDYEVRSNGDVHEFRVIYYPHTKEGFRRLVDGAFGKNCIRDMYGDFKPLETYSKPYFYVYVIEKSVKILQKGGS